MQPKLGWTISRKARTPVLTRHISKLAALAGSLLPWIISLFHLQGEFWKWAALPPLDLGLHSFRTPNCQGNENRVSRPPKYWGALTEKNSFTEQILRYFLTTMRCGKLLWSAAAAARNVRMSGNTCSLGTALLNHTSEWKISQRTISPC